MEYLTHLLQQRKSQKQDFPEVLTSLFLYFFSHGLYWLEHVALAGWRLFVFCMREILQEILPKPKLMGSQERKHKHPRIMQHVVPH